MTTGNLKVIWRLSWYSLEVALANRLLTAIFVAAKLIRIGMFIFFLNKLLESTGGLGEYRKDQVTMFYLTYTFVDSLGQLLFREVYRFRQLLISGNFDLVLAKPMSPLLRVLIGGVDPMDGMVSVILAGSIVWYGIANGLVDGWGWILYGALILNALLIVAAIHILILSVGVLTTVVDNLILAYRDLSALARIPIDTYGPAIRAMLTFVIPIGIMVNVPTKALYSLASVGNILTAFAISMSLISVSNFVWKRAMRKYESSGG